MKPPCYATLQSESYDAVIHFAAFIEAGESMKEPGRFFKNNFTNTLTLLDCMSKAGIPRLVFSSTAGIFASNDKPLDEDSPIGPASVYGQTKWMVEQSLEWYGRIHGLKYACLRYFNAAGALPGRGEAHQPESHLIPLVLQVALGQRPTSPYSVPTTPHRMGQISAITFTSATWSAPTCWRWKDSITTAS